MNWRKNLSNLRFWLLENSRNLVRLFAGLALTVALIASQICLVFITTPSIPYSLCLQVYHATPQKYDLCAFNYKGRKLVKYIIGVEGDKIMNLADAIYVDGFRVGKAERSAQLTPLEDGIEIPAGYVFVSGRHPKSLAKLSLDPKFCCTLQLRYASDWC